MLSSPTLFWTQAITILSQILTQLYPGLKGCLDVKFDATEGGVNRLGNEML